MVIVSGCKDTNKRVKYKRKTSFFSPVTFLVHINRCAMRECDAIGCVEGFQVHLVVADAQTYGHDSTQQLTVLARIEARCRQLVPALLRLIVDDGLVTDSPYKVIGGLTSEPRLQHMADAEPLILSSEELPRYVRYQVPGIFGWRGCNMLRKKPKYYIDFMKKTTNNDFLVSLIQNIGKMFGYCRNFAYLCPHK